MRESAGMHRSIHFIIAGAVCLAAAGAPIAAARTDAKKSAPAGVVFGGRTAQRFPIAVEVSHDGRQVVRADVALEIRCGAGTSSVFTDAYQHLPLRSTGSFQSSFSGQRIDLASGQKGVISGTIKGKINARKTSMTGTWTFNVEVHDPTTDAVVDHCQSGNVTWTIKQ
jgi:hypothetical protein